MAAPVSYSFNGTNPSIEVVEQPATHHRFRYESEAPGNRLGGLLYGRSGGKSTCVKLRISGLDPNRHREIIVTGGTLNPDLYPHPYYMVGDNCEPSGLFVYKRPVTSGEMIVSLEKVSLICVGKIGGKLAAAIKKRNDLGFNPFEKNTQEVKYTSRNVNQLKLAFQLQYTDCVGVVQLSSAPVAVTDVIMDIKLLVKLTIDSVLPTWASLCGGQEMWIYFKDPLPHEYKAQYQVSLGLDGTQLWQLARIERAQKHLLSIVTPDLQSVLSGSGFESERIRASLLVADLRSGVESSSDVILTDSCSHCGLRFLASEFAAAPGAKRKRPAAAGGGGGDPSVAAAVVNQQLHGLQIDDPMQELLDGFLQ